MASNHGTNGGRPRTNKFVPEGGGGWSRQPQQAERSKYNSGLNGQQKQVLAQLTEMFGQSLEREIILTIAESCDWNVNMAIENLIEISQENGYAPKPANQRRNPDVRPPNRQRQSPPVAPLRSAIKVAYQGYDNTEDADVIVEEEEEFEVVTRAPVDHVSRIQATSAPEQQNSLANSKKIRKYSQSPTHRAIHAAISNGDRIMVLMRGMPGSGKTYAARQLLATTNTGAGDRSDLHVFSTDDYFVRGGRFRFTPENLPEAHEWNRKRVSMVMLKGVSPVIVDNTNTQSWEMKPYIHLAVMYGYAIELLEPNTPWCWRDAELAQRNVHNVPRHTIRKMIERYEKWSVGQLLVQLNLRYSPGQMPPQRCSNPPPISKTGNLNTKPSDTLTRTSNNIVKPANSNNNKHTNSQKPSLPLGANICDKKVLNIDLLSDNPPLSQRVKREVDKPTLLDAMDKLVWEIGSKKEDSASPDTDFNKESMELPPTPPEWQPLSWDTVLDVQPLLVDVQDSTEVLPLKDSPKLSVPPVVCDETELFLDQLDQPVSLKNSLDVHFSLEVDNTEVLVPTHVDVLKINDSLLDAPNQPEEINLLQEVIAEATDTDQLLPGFNKLAEGSELSNESRQLDIDAASLIKGAEEVCDGEPNDAVQLDKAAKLIENVKEPQEEISPAEVVATVQPSEDETSVIVGVMKAGDIDLQTVEEDNFPIEPEAFSLVNPVPLSVIESEQLAAASRHVPTVSSDKLLHDFSAENNADVKQSLNDASEEITSVPEAVAEEVQIKEPSPPKLGIFAWLFSKKENPVSIVKKDSSPPQRAWQPYEPQNSVIGVNDMRVPEAVIQDSCAVLAGVEKQAEDEQKAEAVSLEPMSLLLDAAELCQAPEDNNADNSTPSVLINTLSKDQKVEIATNDIESKAMNVALNETDKIPEINDDADNSVALSETNISANDVVDDSTASAVDSPEEVAVEIIVESSKTEDDIPELSIGNVDCWAKLNPSYVLADEISNCTLASPMKEVKCVSSPPKRDSETNTAHADFSLLGQELQNELPVISGSRRSINDGATAIAARPLSSTYMLDKGSMTSPVEDEPSDNDFELLIKMFPKIPRDDLIEVFEKCLKEINWTVEVLLESGYAFEPAADLEVRFEDSDQLLHTQELLEELNSRDSSLIKSQMSEDVAFLADSLIIGGAESKGRSTHFGLFGSNESLDEATIPETKPLEAKTSPTKKPPKKQSQLTLQLKKQMEETFVLNPDCYSEEMMRIKRIRHGESSTAKPSCSEVPNVEEHSRPSSTPKTHVPEQSLTVSCDRLPLKSDSEDDPRDDDDTTTIPLTLDAKFLEHLRQLFGEPLLPCADGVAVVDLPVSLARQIHSYLAESQVKQLEMQEQYFQNMIKDEEFARRLQEEEMPAPDLRQIMDMELALELYRSDSAPRQTGEDLATRLSKQKLAELFPGVDRMMLFDVFEAHGRSFAETVEVLEASTGELDEAARTVMSPQVMAAYEKQLLNKAKEETSKQTLEEAKRSLESASRRAATPKEQAINDAKGYRDEANRLYQLRNECYQQANNAQRSNMPSVASYYAQVGHLYKQRIEELNSHAASALLSAHSLNHRSTTLDLHFLYVAEALEALDIFLDHHIARLNDVGTTNAETLFIITGSGQHSVGGRPRIRPAVQRRLAQRKLRYQEVNVGMLSVVVTKNAQVTK